MTVRPILGAAIAALLFPMTATPKPPPPAKECVVSSASTLPGVSIGFPGAKCRFTLAQAKAGITLPYVVQVDAPLDGVVSRPQDAGHCGRPDDASRLILFEQLSDEGAHRYSVYDTGLCPPAPITPLTLKPGTYEYEFKWDGRAWSGPSDTGQKKGAAFPPGTYTLKVTAVGTRKDGGAEQKFEVRGELTITLIR